ncbi:MAG: YdcF family protein [Myxococcales bacterium]|nr:YdcF family protein [Myxococcales bacterium]
MWLFLFVVLPLAVVFGSVALVYTAQTIPKRFRGRCYDDVVQIPANRVGLVLGCARNLRSGRPNLYFTKRIEAAAALFRAGKVERLLASGASRGADINEVTSMKQALIEAGVPADCIVCDHHGYRTIDSVLRAQLVYGQDRLTIISQPFHNQRALYLAEHRGIDAVGFNAADVLPPRGRKVRFREFFARMRVVIDIHINHTQPRVLGKREPL